MGYEIRVEHPGFWGRVHEKEDGIDDPIENIREARRIKTGREGGEQGAYWFTLIMIDLDFGIWTLWVNDEQVSRVRWTPRTLRSFTANDQVPEYRRSKTYMELDRKRPALARRMIMCLRNELVSISDICWKSTTAEYCLMITPISSWGLTCGPLC